MVNIPYQNELKINVPGDYSQEKSTLQLSPTGDLQLISGSDKLYAQLLRAIVNEDVLGENLLNSKSINNRILKSLLTLTLRNFRQNQIDEVKRSDPEFSGFIFYRKAAGTNESFVKVSADPITWKFTDTDLTNGVEYTYGVSKVFNNVFESAYTEKVSVTPSQFTNHQDTTVGERVVAIEGNREVTFYVDYNKIYRASELLDEIVSIYSEQDPQEPRRYIVSITVKDLRENKVSLDIRRMAL